MTRKTFLAVGLAACLFSGLFMVHAQMQASSSASGSSAAFGPVMSRYMMVSYEGDVDLRRVNGRIRVWLRDTLLDIPAPPASAPVEQQLGDKLDRIFFKVQKVLDMYPRAVPLVVHFVKTSAEIQQRYCAASLNCTHNGLPAFYDDTTKTILISEQGITAGVVAHEMAHVIARAYFGRNPPKGVDELMAQYAEMHLED